jgi:UDP:flavonoid glycosyltransferase YjiC (YdhE family)
MLHKEKVSVKAIQEYAERLLAEPEFAREAKRVGDSLREAGGVARAADEIEGLLDRGAPMSLA